MATVPTRQHGGCLHGDHPVILDALVDARLAQAQRAQAVELGHAAVGSPAGLIER